MRRIIYMLSHTPHAEQLVTSLYTLRKHYEGFIDVHGWDEPDTSPTAWDIVETIAQDKRLGIDPIRRRPEKRGRYDHLIDKIDIAKLYDEGTTLLLDCDTLIAGELTPLFDVAESYGCCMTQYCNWVTTNKVMQTRIKRMLNCELSEEEKLLVEACLSVPHPSPNVGIFAVKAGSPVLPVWRELTVRCRDIFIADEITMQALQCRFVPALEMIIVSGIYNNSTMRYGKWVDPERVVVWHGHGGSFVRKEKSPRGFDMWMKVRSECHEKNIGGIRDWHAQTTSKHLKKSLETIKDGDGWR